MIWGVGTGRCGTRSTAELLGGLHEPRPKLWTESIAYATAGTDANILLDRLRARMDLGAPAVVDLQQAFVVPLIQRVDPGASFVWLVRHPLHFVASWLAGGWTRSDRHPERKLRPAGGWSEAWSPLQQATWTWCEVNRILERDLEGHVGCVELWLTHELPASTHANSYRASSEMTFTRTQAAEVMDATAAQWLRLQQRAQSPRPKLARLR